MDSTGEHMCAVFFTTPYIGLIRQKRMDGFRIYCETAREEAKKLECMHESYRTSTSHEAPNRSVFRFLDGRRERMKSNQ
jgi:hypothetical protein